MEDDCIKLFITGGTIDKVYNPLNGDLIFSQSHIPEIIDHSRCKINIITEVIMLKDSLFMNDSDRERILQICKSSNENKIVITHGTDTMVETAMLLGKNVNDKTIILTGAMVPYKFGVSDASFNLGFALASVQTLPSGIYIVMNGKIFEWNNVRKNKLLGEFEETNQA
jgi:L-asparaginase